MSKKYKYTKNLVYEGVRYKIRADDPLELGRKYEKKLQELKAHRRVVSGDTLLRDWAMECITTYKTKQSEVTRKKYVARVRHCILEHIGDMPLKKIKPMHCQQVMNMQKGNSNRQINEVFQAMRFIFKYALANSLIASDPTEFLVKPAGKAVASRRALTHHERQTVIQVAKTDRRYYYYLLMLLCGCRPSEAAECKVSDVSMMNGHAMLHIRGKKSGNADRIVPMPAELYELVRKLPPFDYIAQNSRGNKITNSQRLWSSFKRELNLAMGCRTYRNRLVPPYPVAPDLVPYCLRHEYCTELARKGVDLRLAQKLMGHSTIDLTANIYTNLETSDVLIAAAKIEGGTTDGTPMPRKLAK